MIDKGRGYINRIHFIRSGTALFGAELAGASALACILFRVGPARKTDFTLRIESHAIEIPPGLVVKTLAYNGDVSDPYCGCKSDWNSSLKRCCSEQMAICSITSSTGRSYLDCKPNGRRAVAIALTGMLRDNEISRTRGTQLAQMVLKGMQNPV
jgi:hypothetical protein